MKDLSGSGRFILKEVSPLLICPVAVIQVWLLDKCKFLPLFGNVNTDIMQRVADIRAELETLPGQNIAMEVCAEGSETFL